MKRCIECQQEKPASEFGKRSVAKDGLNPRCRPCRRAFEQRHYERNGDHVRAKRRAELARYQARNARIIADHLVTHHCVDCGESDPIVLEFDHVRGTKARNISRLRLEGAAEATLRAEIAKCEVRCANCHRRVTHQRARSAGRTPSLG